MAKPDLKDRKLLHELDKNCRQSYQQLGRRLRVGKSTVRYRIENLKQAGIIKGFHTIINYGLLGRIGYRIYLNLQNTTPKEEKEMIEYLKRKNKVTWLASMNGHYNLGIFMEVNKIHEINEFWEDLMEKFINYFDERLITIMTSTQYFSAAYLADIKKNNFIIGMDTTHRAQTDELDIKILRLIANNALMPVIEIAAAVKKTSKTVISRIKRLEKQGIILGYKSFLDYEKLGYQHYKISFILLKLTKGQMGEFREFSMQHPNIVYMEQHIGGADVEIGVQVKNPVELRRILDEIRSRFAGVIHSHQILDIFEEHKSYYFPLQG